MRLLTRHPKDQSREITIVLTERQLEAIIRTLRELSLILEYSYNQLTDEDKKYAKLAQRELMKSRTWNLLEKIQLEARP
ncbi:hypothetical protein GZ77_18145 [Endozoicomonas montiporae]|uniref:Uncharacterized protein n=2 Tax=Endozoicomonas montiporae TaxID=1027273 RepID=A0A081N1X5_9GAMM|nr:hypothetical protein [Endozoicomonas montiporae]AMO58602.1 hypothetical protein EZMO1_4699 [Endozoicomonas montiporae CL-33]KEQ12448.1 hypothetical protein GZ77_18145 [Endozoicomonas montiporae]